MATKKLDYQTLSTELDEIMDKLQAEDVDVDEAVKLYAKGTQLVAALEQHLKEAENTITKIKTSLK